MAAVLLVEFDGPFGAGGQALRLFEIERCGAIDVPIAGQLDRPAGSRIAIDRMSGRKALLLAVGFSPNKFGWLQWFIALGFVGVCFTALASARRSR